MPEMIEVEAYRRLAASGALGRLIAGVDAPDAWYLKGGLDAVAAQAALGGRRFTAARRRGKLLLLDTDDGGPVLGLRFGMSGRLVVDGTPGTGRLLHGAGLETRYDRFAVVFADGGNLVMSDPRRLGGVELEPSEDRLGVDAFEVDLAALRQAVAGARTPIKARLLDQTRIAGIGNLLADEILWRAGLSPLRPAGELSPAALARLVHHMAEVLAELSARGGSHTGDLMAERHPGGRCRRDGSELARATVSGRTTYWCPRHQR